MESENKSCSVSISELVKEINRMLQENPRAVRLVYAYLIGLTGSGKGKEAA